MPDHQAAVLVIGSVNIDHVVIAEAFPAPGQTVPGTAVRSSIGGKGANQAVAAALAGGTVARVAHVGGDDEGVKARQSLAERGVDVTAVTVLDGVSTGTAWITVAEHDNTIVVVPGANGHWSDHGDPLGGAGRAAAVVLAQLEIPQQVVRRAAAAQRGVFVLNAAPAARLHDDLLACCDVLVVNQHELDVVAEIPGAGGDTESVDGAHQALRSRSVGAVVTTLGPASALVTENDGTSSLLPAVPATIVDTTGAGDAFTGVLAARLAHGDTLTTAARWATAAGSLAVRAAGTQESYPDLRTLDRTVQEATQA